jgi:Na+-driven multidrug efflux pump
MMPLFALLLQEGSTGAPTAIGIARFFMGLFLILILYGGAWAFTYWISKDE